MGRIIPYIMENKTCSKPPTSTISLLSQFSYPISIYIYIYTHTYIYIYIHTISSSKITLKSTPADLLATLPAAQLARLPRLARATRGAIGVRERDAVAQGGEAQGGKPRRDCGRKLISTRRVVHPWKTTRAS